MTAAASSPAFTVRGPADLINAVPYLLGFHPVDSLVVVGMCDGRVVVTIRIDLDVWIGEPGIVEQSLAAMRRGGAGRFIGILFDEVSLPDWHAETLPWDGLVSELVSAVHAVDGEVGDVLLVGHGRYWSYSCFGAGCCPDEGVPVSPDSSEVPARATFAGMVALPDRDAVDRLLEPLPEDERAALLPAIDAAIDAAMAEISAGRQERLDRSDVRALFAAAREAAAGSVDLDEEALARYATALRRLAVRDSLWVGIDEQRLTGDALWWHLARALPDPYRAAPLFLIAWTAWRSGSGALAAMAAERAIAADSDYSAADLLLAALSNGVDPRAMPRIRRPARRYGR
jgi:hypothetical protein